MSRPHVVTPSELQSLRDLELVARTTVEGLRQGLHRSPFHGYSAEFSQYRHYRPGDDLKYVDWKVFARTDRLYTRQFRETTNLAALFVVDVSPSMDFERQVSLWRSRWPRCSARWCSIKAMPRALLAVERDGAHYLPPRSGHHHLTLFLRKLARLSPSGATSVCGRPRARRRAAEAARPRRRGLGLLRRRRGRGRALRRLARMGHEVVVVQTLSTRTS